jgi:hypothetical protein
MKSFGFFWREVQTQFSLLKSATMVLFGEPKHNQRKQYVSWLTESPGESHSSGLYFSYKGFKELVPATSPLPHSLVRNVFFGNRKQPYKFDAFFGKFASTSLILCLRPVFILQLLLFAPQNFITKSRSLVNAKDTKISYRIFLWSWLMNAFNFGSIWIPG